MEIDFLCVGFAKCGTTTFDNILRQYSQVVLPVIKEPHFFRWKDGYDFPVQKLINEYFEQQVTNTNKCMGMVDPTLTHMSVDDLIKYFGENTKIIVMLRNPVKAFYSEFKMGLRIGYYWGYYYPFKKVNVGRMFDSYLEHIISGKCNANTLEYFFYDRYLENIYQKINKKYINLSFLFVN